jgi:uncharacterized protein YjiS (DUF1127 family)
MNACTTLPAAIPLHRPLGQRIVDTLADGWRRMRASVTAAQEPLDLPNALALNDHMLRDIGVSEALREQAAAQRGIAAMAARFGQQDFAERGRHWYG